MTELEHTLFREQHASRVATLTTLTSFEKQIENIKILRVKVAQFSLSGSIPPKFEHKLRRHKQRFGKIATSVV